MQDSPDLLSNGSYSVISPSLGVLFLSAVLLSRSVPMEYRENSDFVQELSEIMLQFEN